MWVRGVTNRVCQFYFTLNLLLFTHQSQTILWLRMEMTPCVKGRGGYEWRAERWRLI